MKNLSLQLKADINLLHKTNPTERILEAIVTSPKKSTQNDRKPLNLSIVIDKSGSMQGDKLVFVKKAVEQVLSLLDERDQFSAIAFDSQVYEISPSRKANAANKAEVLAKVRELSAGTNTNLSGGWLSGAHQVAENRLDQGVNRVLLLTDGLANEGIVDVEALAEHASQLHSRGVSTSTFGVGRDFNEQLLELMATNGGGNYYFIQHPTEIPGIFSEELDELAAITASDVELQVSIPAHVSINILGSWKHDKTQKRIKVFLGDLPSETEQPVYFKLIAPPQSKRKTISLSAAVHGTGEDGALLENIDAKLVLKYAEEDVIARAIPDPVLVRKAASVFVADAALKAHRLEKRGEYKEAKKLLDMALLQFGSKLDDQEMARYEDLSRKIQYGLDPVAAKRSHINSYVGSRSMPRRIKRERDRK